MISVQADPIPIREETDGTLRVGKTRVLLELVINSFENGTTPETIVQNYSTLRLSDVYAVIGHYLNHRNEIQDYLAQRESLATQVAAQVSSNQRDLSEIRQRLLKK